VISSENNFVFLLVFDSLSTSKDGFVKDVNVAAKTMATKGRKMKSVGSSTFQKNLQRLDQPTLIIFFAFLKKKYNDWIKSFSKSKWTGLMANS
jgi:hypothetical protein